MQLIPNTSFEECNIHYDTGKIITLIFDVAGVYMLSELLEQLTETNCYIPQGEAEGGSLVGVTTNLA